MMDPTYGMEVAVSGGGEEGAAAEVDDPFARRAKVRQQPRAIHPDPF